MNRTHSAIILLFTFLLLSQPPGSTGQMSKLCIDPQCKEPLFASTFSREHLISHDNFLQGKEGTIVRVMAFKFSNRVDIMEAMDESGNRGMVYSSHIDLEPYVYALEAVLKQNSKLYVVNADPTAPVTAKRLLGEREANPEVLRDYEVHAKKLSLEVTAFDSPASSSSASHSAEHGGHGHSHSHSHDTHHVHHPSAEESAAKEEGERANEKLPPPPQETQTTAEPTRATPSVSTTNESSRGNAIIPPAETPPPDPVVNRGAAVNVSVPNDTDIKAANETPPPEPVLNATETQAEPSLNESVAGVGESPPPDPAVSKDSAPVGEAKAYVEDQPAATTTLPPQPVPQDPVVKTIPLDPASIIHKQAAEQPLLRRKLSTFDALGGMLDGNKVQGSGEASGGGGEKVEVTTAATPSSVTDPYVPDPTSTVIPMTTTFSPRTAAPPPRVEETVSHGKEAAAKMADEAQSKPYEALNNTAVATHPSPPPEAVAQQPPTTSSAPSTPETTTAPPPSSTIPPPPPVVHEPTTAAPVDESRVLAEAAPPATTNAPPPPPPSSPSENTAAVRNEPVVKTESTDGKSMASAEASEPPSLTTTHVQPSMETAQKEKYCHKDDCGEFHPEHAPTRDHAANESNGWHHGVGSAIRAVLEPARSLLPAPLCYFDFTGLLVLAFLLISLTMHLANMCLSSSAGRDYVDGRVLHDCMSRLKEQELLLKRYQQNTAQLKKLAETGSAAERILKENEQLETRLHQLEKSSAEREKERDSLKSLNDRQKEKLAEKAREIAKLKDVLQEREAQIKELNDHNDSLSDRLSKSSSTLEQVRLELEQLKQSGEVVESRLRDKAAEVDRLEGRLHSSVEECNLHKNQCDEMQAQMDELLQMIAQLQQQKEQQDANGQSSAATKANGDENGAGSGGSGWSDLGEQMIDVGEGDEEGTLRSSSERQRGAVHSSSPPPSSTADETGSTGGGRRKLSATALLEVAQLKAELKRTETDREACRISLANERKERDALNRRVEQLREDLAEKRREAEQREKERHDLQSQCSKLLVMVEERDRKLESIDAERERLRTKIAQTDTDLRNVEDNKRELLLKLKELERDMRRVEEVNGKLENRLYHEDRRLTSRIRLLEEQLARAQAAAANSSAVVLGDLNMSGGSSDPELTGGPNALRAHGSDVPSLWSDVEGMDMLDDFSPPKPGLPRQSQSRAAVPHRGSPFVLASDASTHPLDRSSTNNSRAAMANRAGEGERRGSATNRRRSRSTERQSAKLSNAGSRGVVAQYPVGVYGPRPLSAKNNKSANSSYQPPPQLYYSSEGSNGGRSPPPEMPLLSGVPPPGLAAKRPTVVMPVPVGSSASSSKLAHVQIHKPANLK